MKLGHVIEIWNLIKCRTAQGRLDYCDLEKAIDKVVGIENNLYPSRPKLKIPRVQCLKTNNSFHKI